MGSASQTVVNRSAPAMQLPLLMGLERECRGANHAALARWGAARKLRVGGSCLRFRKLV